MAIRAIDQKRGGMPNEGHFYERKIALLAKEDQIEADFEKMVQLIIPSPFPSFSISGAYEGKERTSRIIEK